jgi:hypothetical protein
MSEPRIAWQPRERKLVVKPVEANDAIMKRAAEWRFIELSKNEKRKSLLLQLKQVTDKLSDPNRVPDVTDAATLKEFYRVYSSISPAASGIDEIALSILGDSNRKRKLTRSLKRFYDEVWEKPLLYQIGEMPLSEAVIVRMVVQARKNDFVDMDGVVGRAMFKLAEKVRKETISDETTQGSMVSCMNPLSHDNVKELIGVINHASSSSKKDGNLQVAQLLLDDIKKGAVGTMNEGGMIRWILDDRACIENLLPPECSGLFFPLLGLISQGIWSISDNRRGDAQALSLQINPTCHG